MNIKLLKFLIDNVAAVIEINEDKDLALDLLEEIDEVLKKLKENNEKLNEGIQDKISALQLIYSLMQVEGN